MDIPLRVALMTGRSLIQASSRTLEFRLQPDWLDLEIVREYFSESSENFPFVFAIKKDDICSNAFSLDSWEVTVGGGEN